MSDWAEELADRLELLRELAWEKGIEAVRSRKKRYDKGSVERMFEKGDRVLLRTPGLVGKLEEYWSGPWEVVDVCGPVTYKVRMMDKRGKGKVVYLNSMKKYTERGECVRRLTVVMEDDDENKGDLVAKNKVVGEGTCMRFDQTSLNKVLVDFSDTLNESPGLTLVTEMAIDTGDCTPIMQHPYRPPESLIPGIKEELDLLLEQGIIVKSTSQ